MKRFLSFFLLGLICCFGFFNLSKPIRADEVEDLQREIDELEKLKKFSEDATKPLEAEVKNLEGRIKGAQTGIATAKQKALELARSIEKREEELAVQYTILTKRIAASYKRSRVLSPIMILVASDDASTVTKDVMYSSRVQAQDNQLLKKIVADIDQLEIDKKKLESDQIRLASLEKKLSEQSTFFQKEIAGAKAYQQQLGGKIADLSAKQQAIINARSGSNITSVGEVPIADDFNASIAYKEKAPSNSFAVFSFGAYTHRKGMSQYGAKARADAGQSVEEILKAYYPNAELKKDYPEMNNITVDGVGSISFEDQYLQGIFEMPGSWHINALKAQAIAARTYALRYTNNGAKSICTTESCQVFKNQKKGGDWEKAVKETKGWVLLEGGQPAATFYASTHGGYSSTAGWDTKGKDHDGDWSTGAWENIAASPWFYKAWYRSGYTKSGENCGRDHPWLSEKEFADIINAWIVRKDPKGADMDRIAPVTINSCNVGGQGGNPYSLDDLKNLADKSGGAVTSISSVVVSHNDNGTTTSVKLKTNRGEINIAGDEFKTTFNIRAPGYLRIPQSNFAFFNIEHKK